MILKLLLFCTFATCVLTACYTPPAAEPAANALAEAQKKGANMAANVNQVELASANTETNAGSANTVSNLANVEIAAPPPDSPAVAIKALAEASKSKDVAAIRQLFNRKSLQMVADQAKATGKTDDETLLGQQIITLASGATEGRNQHVEGDTASVEVRASKTGAWQKIFFTREDGKWKVAMDKFMDEIMRQVLESTKSLEQKSDDGKDK
jgi:ketosteroid isomerase-like protein